MSERMLAQFAEHLDRLKQTVETVPQLPDQRLAQVEHLKIDKPGHDDMRDDDELRDVEDQHQNLEKRGHRALRSGVTQR